jgi:hypothetical protein
MATRKKRRNLKYPRGVLTSPVPGTIEARSEAIDAIIDALANFYGITAPSGTLEFWIQLSIKLICHHVPALKPPARGGRPREHSKYFKFVVRFEMTRLRLKRKSDVIDARVIEAIAQEDGQEIDKVRRKWTRARKAIETSPTNDRGSYLDSFLGLADRRKLH